MWGNRRAGEGSLQDFLAANPDFLEQAGELEGGLEGAGADPSPIMRFSSDGSMMEQLMRTASSKCAAAAILLQAELVLGAGQGCSNEVLWGVMFVALVGSPCGGMLELAWCSVQSVRLT